MTGQVEPSVHPSSVFMNPDVILDSTLCSDDFQSTAGTNHHFHSRELSIGDKLRSQGWGS